MESGKRIALVSGGSRGIGREITKKLASEGFMVLFTFRSNAQAAVELENELYATWGVRPAGYQCDMTKTDEVKALFKQIKKEYGHLDVLINNAGILGSGRPFMMTSDEEWWNVMNTNISCVINPSRMVLPMMISRKQGIIINITSLSGQKGNPGQSAYSASKAAVVSFSKALSKEVGALGIVINCVSPGLIQTDMTDDINKNYFEKRIIASPLKRMGEPNEVADLVCFLAQGPQYLIGQEITIDGGIGG